MQDAFSFHVYKCPLFCLADMVIFTWKELACMSVDLLGYVFWDSLHQGTFASAMYVSVIL